ncbi:MAG: hypothetical protein ACT4OJ_14405 [Bacteroidota bacterium]
MKKIILIGGFLLPLALQAQQSSKSISFYLQGGYRSAPYIKEAGHKGIVSTTETNHHRCIIFNAGLQWDIADKWRIGPSFTYDHFGTKHRSVEFSNLSYLLRLDRTWVKKKNYNIYSGAAAGIRKVRKFEDETETARKTVLGYQIYLAGFNYKVFNRFFLDVNAGWGVSGIVSVGAKYRF